MNNWIITLEEKIGTDYANATVQMLSLSLTVLTIMSSHWQLMV